MAAKEAQSSAPALRGNICELPRGGLCLGSPGLGVSLHIGQGCVGHAHTSQQVRLCQVGCPALGLSLLTMSHLF